MDACRGCTLTLSNCRLSKISNTATFKSKISSWLLTFVSQSGSLSGLWSKEFPLELSPEGKEEKKANGKMGSLESEEALSPHRNSTEFVCISRISRKGFGIL